MITLKLGDKSSSKSWHSSINSKITIYIILTTKAPLSMKWWRASAFLRCVPKTRWSLTRDPTNMQMAQEEPWVTRIIKVLTIISICSHPPWVFRVMLRCQVELPRGLKDLASKRCAQSRVSHSSISFITQFLMCTTNRISWQFSKWVSKSLTRRTTWQFFLEKHNTTSTSSARISTSSRYVSPHSVKLSRIWMLVKLPRKRQGRFRFGKMQLFLLNTKNSISLVSSSH